MKQWFFEICCLQYENSDLPEPKRRCLLTGCFKRNQFVPEFRGFYKNVGILLGGVSDCEESVGVAHRR